MILIFIPYFVSFFIVLFLIFYSLKFTEKSHMRERSRLLGKYVRENLPQPVRSIIDKIISPYFLRQFMVILELLSGSMEGIEGKEQLVILEKLISDEKQLLFDNNNEQLLFDNNNEQSLLDGEQLLIDDKRSIDNSNESLNNEESLNDNNDEPLNDNNEEILNDNNEALNNNDNEPLNNKLLINQESSNNINNEPLNNIIGDFNNEQIVSPDIKQLELDIEQLDIDLDPNLDPNLDPDLDPDIKRLETDIPINNLPINMKSDQEFIKRSLTKINDASIDLSDDEENNDNNYNDSVNNYSIDDGTNRFIETTEQNYIKIIPKRIRKKTSIEKEGKKLRIRIKKN